MNAAATETFLPTTNEFLDSVLRLDLRVAAFDCDGTLWAGDAGERFFDQFFDARIFPEMRELVRRLQANGCEVWSVSSTNEWVIRAAMKHFAVPESRVLAAKVEVEAGICTDRLIRVPSGPGKPEALREAVINQIDAAFGNSRWDTEMLAMAKHAFAINTNPDLESTARERGWRIYFPEGTRLGDNAPERKSQ